MSFVDYFRPKWKHSNITVRSAAVRELDPERLDVLRQVVIDEQDAAIRRIAVKKLSEPKLLSQIAEQDPDQSIRQCAADKMAELLVATATAATNPTDCLEALAQIKTDSYLVKVAQAAQLQAVRQAAFERISDSKALAELARATRDPAIRMAAVGRIAEPAVLRSLALSEDAKDAALLAVTELHDVAALQEVARKSKNKTVRRKAQQKLEARKQTGATAADQKQAGAVQAATSISQRNRRAKAAQVVRNVEALIRNVDLKAAQIELSRYQAKWQELVDDADEQLEQQFYHACEAFEAHVQKTVVAQQLAEQKRLAERSRVASAPSLSTSVESSISSATVSTPPSHDSNTSTSVTVQRDRRATQEVPPSAAELAVLAQAAELASNASISTARQALPDLRRQLQELANGHRSAALAQWRGIEQKLQDRIAAERTATQQRLTDQRADLEQICHELETLLQKNEDVRAIRKELTALNEKWRAVSRGKAPAALRERWELSRRTVNGMFRELEQAEAWKSWATVPQRQTLCEQMEALANVEDLADVAQQMRQIRQQWQQLGPTAKHPKADKDPTVERFEKAAEQMRMRCQAYFDQRKVAGQDNLKLKETLCQSAEALVHSEAWAETAAELKRMQEQWQQVGPTPRAEGTTLWKRFRSACNQFFARHKVHQGQLRQERAENLKLKQALCEEAESLAQSTDWEPTAEKLRRLKTQWKQIGPVMRQEADAVWKRFQTAADTFFTRRREHQDAQKNGDWIALAEVCKQIEAVLATPPEDTESIKALLQPMTDRYRWVREVAEATTQTRKDAIETFRDLSIRVIETHPTPFDGTPFDPNMSLRRRERLCEQMESLAEQLNTKVEKKPAQAASPQSVEQMVEKLRGALAANALGGANAETTTPQQEIDKLVDAWEGIGWVIGDAAKKLNARFEVATQKSRQAAATHVDHN